MKYLLFCTAMVCCLVTSTSCNRSYSCTCTYNTNGTSKAVDAGDIKGSKNHALHECCVIRAAQIKQQVNADVTCAVPI